MSLIRIHRYQNNLILFGFVLMTLSSLNAAETPNALTSKHVSFYEDPDCENDPENVRCDEEEAYQYSYFQSSQATGIQVFTEDPSRSEIPPLPIGKIPPGTPFKMIYVQSESGLINSAQKLSAKFLGVGYNSVDYIAEIRAANIPECMEKSCFVRVRLPDIKELSTTELNRLLPKVLEDLQKQNAFSAADCPEKNPTHPPPPSEADEWIKGYVSCEQFENYVKMKKHIKKAAEAFGFGDKAGDAIGEKRLACLITRESRFNPNAINNFRSHCGLGQFDKGSLDYVSKLLTKSSSLRYQNLKEGWRKYTPKSPSELTYDAVKGTACGGGEPDAELAIGLIAAHLKAIGAGDGREDKEAITKVMAKTKGTKIRSSEDNQFLLMALAFNKGPGNLPSMVRSDLLMRGNSPPEDWIRHLELPAFVGKSKRAIAKLRTQAQIEKAAHLRRIQQEAFRAEAKEYLAFIDACLNNAPYGKENSKQKTCATPDSSRASSSQASAVKTHSPPPVTVNSPEQVIPLPPPPAPPVSVAAPAASAPSVKPGRSLKPAKTNRPTPSRPAPPPQAPPPKKGR